jgi:BirA family transcriptional regulator, biotin operon repressor / biotin---[acetyl-CoA-carboxylase] ligase
MPSVVGRYVIHLEEVTSTNDLALRMAGENVPEGSVVIAERQTRGRGKQGKRWESPTGGLWTSVVLRPKSPSSQAPIFTLMGAVASAEAIRIISGVQVLIRWPNDLLLEGKKIGGILCEARVGGNKIRHLVMGIGINVNQGEGDFSSSLRGLATSLRIASGRVWEREAVAEAIYDRLGFWYHRLQRGDLPSLFVPLSEISEGDASEWNAMKQMLGVP